MAHPDTIRYSTHDRLSPTAVATIANSANQTPVADIGASAMILATAGTTSIAPDAVMAIDSNRSCQAADTATAAATVTR